MSTDTWNNQVIKIKQQIAFCMPGRVKFQQSASDSPQNASSSPVTILGKPDLWLCGVIGFNLRVFFYYVFYPWVWKPAKPG